MCSVQEKRRDEEEEKESKSEETHRCGETMLSSGHVIISAGIESGLYGLHYFVSLAVYPCAVSVLDGDEPKTSSTCDLCPLGAVGGIPL